MKHPTPEYYELLPKTGYVASNAERTYSYVICEDCLTDEDVDPVRIDDVTDSPDTCEGCLALVDTQLTDEGEYAVYSEAAHTAEAWLRYKRHTANNTPTLPSDDPNMMEPLPPFTGAGAVSYVEVEYFTNYDSTSILASIVDDETVPLLRKAAINKTRSWLPLDEQNMTDDEVRAEYDYPDELYELLLATLEEVAHDGRTRQ